MSIRGLGRRLAVVVSMGFACSGATRSTPEWKQGFDLPGTTGPVRTSVTFDDGTGPKLYVAGKFIMAGGVKVPAWPVDGHGVEPVGQPFPRIRQSAGRTDQQRSRCTTGSFMPADRFTTWALHRPAALRDGTGRFGNHSAGGFRARGDIRPDQRGVTRPR